MMNSLNFKLNNCSNLENSYESNILCKMEQEINNTLNLVEFVWKGARPKYCHQIIPANCICSHICSLLFKIQVFQQF